MFCITPLFRRNERVYFLTADRDKVTIQLATISNVTAELPASPVNDSQVFYTIAVTDTISVTVPQDAGRLVRVDCSAYDLKDVVDTLLGLRDGATGAES